jgi:hypothetical protein
MAFSSYKNEVFNAFSNSITLPATPIPILLPKFAGFIMSGKPISVSTLLESSSGDFK